MKIFSSRSTWATRPQAASSGFQPTAQQAQVGKPLHFSASKPEKAPQKAYYGSPEGSAVYTLDEHGKLKFAFYNDDDSDDLLLLSPVNKAAQEKELAELAAREAKDASSGLGRQNRKA